MVRNTQETLVGFCKKRWKTFLLTAGFLTACTTNPDAKATPSVQPLKTETPQPTMTMTQTEIPSTPTQNPTSTPTVTATFTEVPPTQTSTPTPTETEVPKDPYESCKIGLSWTHAPIMTKTIGGVLLPTGFSEEVKMPWGKEIQGYFGTENFFYDKAGNMIAFDLVVYDKEGNAYMYPAKMGDFPTTLQIGTRSSVTTWLAADIDEQKLVTDHIQIQATIVRFCGANGVPNDTLVPDCKIMNKSGEFFDALTEALKAGENFPTPLPNFRLEVQAAQIPEPNLWAK